MHPVRAAPALRVFTGLVSSVEHPMVCVACGSVLPPGDEAGARATWAMAVECGRVVWTCATCSREHLRSIEGKLDPAWW